MIDSSLSNLTELEDSYGLSPLQEGMLFHSLYVGCSGVDIEQLSGVLHEDLNVSAFHDAWGRVVERHPILRTSFRWLGLDTPLQEVHRHVRIPFEQQDWRNLTASQREKRLASYLHSDRREGFKLDRVPLMRLALFHIGEAEYQFIWTFHHALLDGRSFPIVLKEVFAFYEAISRGENPELEQPRPYRDYIEWLQQQDISKAEEFWRGTLSGFAPPKSLISYQPSQPRLDQEQTHGEREVRLSKSTTATLQALAAEHSITVNTIVQGAWALLLSCYSGEDDVVFGATRACRRSDLRGAEAMIGLFINTLPVCARVVPGESLLPWLKGLREQNVASRTYEHTPLSKVQGWSQVAGGTALFETILVFENYRLNTLLRKQGGNWENREFWYKGQTNYPIRLAAFLEPQLLLNIQHDRHRFDDPSISRMLDHLKRLLEKIAANPYQRLSAFSPLTESERQQILVVWNKRRTPRTKDGCVHEMFEAQAKRTPDKIAVVYGEEQLTYAELNNRSNQLAHYLQERRVGPEVTIGVFLERSIDLIVGLLGVLKTGAAYLPLDPTLPSQRVAFLLEDAKAPFVLSTQSLAQRLHQLPAKPIWLDTDREEIDAQSTVNPISGAKAANAVYVMYTSGSTGKPKGVVVEHRQLANYVEAISKRLKLPDGSSFATVSTIAADLGNTVVFPSLCSGGCLHVVEQDRVTDAEAFADYFHRRPVDCLKIVPSHLTALLSASHPEHVLPRRRLVLGGEACSWDLVRLIRDMAPACEILNHYGPTEATVGAVTYMVQEDKDFTKTVPLGRPITNAEIYILNRNLEPVPIGVKGEMYIGGEGVARGYLNNPELTAERFVPNPFNRRRGERLYKTGDLARHLPSGDVEFLGRIDHQVKIGGFRVELKEIEAALAEHPAVQECVVMLRGDEPDKKRLVAYLVVHSGQATSITEMRSFLEQSLPHYMLPSAFVLLDKVPLTPNGKLDRRALPDPTRTVPGTERAHSQAHTAAEKSLARIWVQVLGLEQVGIHDNFFELGGDSIMNIHVVARAARVGLQLTPRQVFQHPTIAELVAVAGVVAAHEAQQDAVTGAIPLTPIQHWFFEQDLPELHHYNQSMLLEVHQTLDSPLLRTAFAKLMVHHDVLRLRFVRNQTQWKQSNGALSEEEEFFEQVDLSEIDEHLTSGIEEVAARVQASLDIEHGPLIRVALMKLGNNRGERLLIAIHHLAVDAVSWGILLEDLQKAYGQLRDGQPVDLGEKTTSYKQWAEFLEEHAKSGSVESEAAYWCADVRRKTSRLPVDHAEAMVNTKASADAVLVGLNAEETLLMLRELPKAYQTQINEVFLTALLQAYAAWSGEHRLLVDLEGHGREEINERVNVTRTVGWFTTIYPVLLELDKDATAEEVLKSVKEQVRSIPNRGIGYGLLKYLGRDRGVSRQLKHHPQAQLRFNYLGQLDQILESSPFTLAKEGKGPEHSLKGTQPYLLDVLGSITGGELQLSWIYNENVFGRATVEKLAEAFIGSLRSLLSHCKSPETGGYKPSDFPEIDLCQQELDELIAQLG